MYLTEAIPHEYENLSYTTESYHKFITEHLNKKTYDCALAPEHRLLSLIWLSFIYSLPKCIDC
jgi:hypothetical protein